jgi:hypothetical protein
MKYKFEVTLANGLIEWVEADALTRDDDGYCYFWQLEKMPNKFMFIKQKQKRILLLMCKDPQLIKTTQSDDE